jgi:hypothetical protein
MGEDREREALVQQARVKNKKGYKPGKGYKGYKPGKGYKGYKPGKGYLQAR